MKKTLEDTMNVAFMTLDSQLKERRNCHCMYHRYHVAHICECGKLYSHSQGDCDEHRQHECITFDSGFISHGDSAKDVYDRLTFFGFQRLETVGGKMVYNYFAENEDKQ